MTLLAHGSARKSSADVLRSPGLWLWAVAIAYFLAQLLLTDLSRFLAWDEAIYISEVSSFADPVVFAAHRARGVTFVVAPVGLLTQSMTVTRFYLALLSSVGVALSFLPWTELIRWVAPDLGGDIRVQLAHDLLRL